MAILREYADNIQRNMHYKLYCFENSDMIYNYAMKFFVRKDFPHLNELNAIIKRASAAGLIEKWRLNSQIKSKYKQNNEVNAYHINSIPDFYGMLLVYDCVLVIGILMLPFELLVYRMKRTANSSRFWMYAEMAIGPDRLILLENKRFQP